MLKKDKASEPLYNQRDLFFVSNPPHLIKIVGKQKEGDVGE